MTDIIERLRIESRREPHEPIWLDAIDEIEALRAEVERLRLMQPVTIGPTGQSNTLTAGEIAAIDAARKDGA